MLYGATGRGKLRLWPKVNTPRHLETLGDVLWYEGCSGNGDANTAKASLPKNGSNRDGTLNISTKELGNVVEMPTSSLRGEVFVIRFKDIQYYSLYDQV